MNYIQFPTLPLSLTVRVTLHQRGVLKREVAKLVLIGDQVGVSTSDMIALLESGLTMGELLEYLALRESGIS